MLSRDCNQLEMVFQPLKPSDCTWTVSL